MTNSDALVIVAADAVGPILSGRTEGAALRRRIEEMVGAESKVIVDFKGVELATPGFADELFAKMPAELLRTGQVAYAHLNGELRVLIELVVAQRSRR